MPPLADLVACAVIVRGGSMLEVASLLEGFRYRATFLRWFGVVFVFAKDYETVKNLEK